MTLTTAATGSPASGPVGERPDEGGAGAAAPARFFARLRLPVAIAVALASGVVWGLTFAGHATRWLPPIALLPLLLLLDHPRACRLGWLHGIAGWTTAMAWILHTLTTYGQIAGWLAGIALLALAAYLGLYHAVFAWLGGRLWRSPARGLWLLLAPLWVVLEALRGVALSGFPWNLAAYSWTTMPGALPLAAWVGAFGVSWLLVAVNVLAARALRDRRVELACLALLVPAIFLPVAGRWASGEAAAIEEHQRFTAVRVVQPNIPNLTMWDPERVASNTQRLFAMSRDACERPALLIWPESAAWPYEYPRDAVLRQAVAELNGAGCAVLLNTPTTEGDATFNSALLIGSGGVAGRADKRHLVPFGEYVPLGKLLPLLGRIARTAGDFSPAHELALLPLGDERLGAAICFEVIFPSEVAELVRAGATVLVTVTNDAWYGDTAAPWQHLRAAQFRAAESRRPLLRAAITGVSAVIAADGRLLATLGVGEQGILQAPIAGRRDLSPYSRAPWLVPLLAFAAVLGGLWRARRAAGRPGRVVSSPAAS